MARKILNITNGDYFNNYFLSIFGGEAIPFREVMMDGDTVPEIYSEEFIALRSNVLGVTTEEYRSKMQVCDVLKKKEHNILLLYFGKDSFCQINLLTLLAYLEQIGFDGKIWLKLIDDESFEIIEGGIVVELGMYQKLYEEILIKKQKPKEIGVLNSRAIDLYFDYLSEDGFLANIARSGPFWNEKSLIRIILAMSKEYGLSDKQVENLVRRNYGKET